MKYAIRGINEKGLGIDVWFDENIFIGNYNKFWRKLLSFIWFDEKVLNIRNGEI